MTRRDPTIRRIIAAVSADTGVSAGDIISDRRTAALVRVRDLAVLLAREMTPASLSAIGREIGDRDHTTVIAALGRAQERLSSDPEWAARYERLRGRLAVPLHPDRLIIAGAVSGPFRRRQSFFSHRRLFG
ncbi:helix-turn-helix domain-containing protein [Roseospirillum parvum]|uniref:DnaA protein helix-turn-helix n=1 Tax=Roseospirillum parvum TaxID=83401 RepID=A0A1G8G6E4_9PROT|nr:helix-turn-helix domain-containing protein [Roseospirillum parvum]SDH89974.1 dnaA protein helix-turn-helix [Roseospirillum parvum]